MSNSNCYEFSSFLNLVKPVTAGKVYKNNTGFIYTVISEGNEYFMRNVTYDKKEMAQKAMEKTVEVMNEEE